MTRSDLVEKLHLLGGLTRGDCEVIVATMLEAMIATLQADDKVEVRGFGSFRTRKRNSSVGRNPKTGARVDVPAKRVVFFTPAKDLRDRVNREALQPTPKNRTR